MKATFFLHAICYIFIYLKLLYRIFLNLNQYVFYRCLCHIWTETRVEANKFQQVYIWSSLLYCPNITRYIKKKTLNCKDVCIFFSCDFNGQALYILSIWLRCAYIIRYSYMSGVRFGLTSWPCWIWIKSHKCLVLWLGAQLYSNSVYVSSSVPRYFFRWNIE